MLRALLRQGLENYVSAKDTFRYPVIYYNLASLCLDLGKLDSAMSLFHEGLGYALAVRPIDVPDYYLSIAEVYVLMDSLTKARELTKRAIEYSVTNDLPYTESIYFLNLSQIHFKESRLDSAIHYAELVLETSDEPTEIEQSLETLYRAYQELGEPQLAFEYLLRLNQELKRREAKGINLKVARIYYERELSKTLQANFELGIENEEKTRDMVILLWALLLLFFMFALISGLLVTNFRVTKAKKVALNSLEQSKNELERALELNRKMQDVMSHDLRTPLSGIISLLELSGDDGITKEELVRFMQQLQENTTVVLAMFDALQKWAHHQNSAIELERHEIDWNVLVNKMKSVAGIQAKKKSIHIEVQQNEDIIINGDPVILETIVRNLLSNAVKFSRENSSIQIISKKSPGKLICSIVDQGVGMTPEMAERLKQGTGISTKGTSGEKGTGLGFRIVNDFVKVHNGSLHIESTLGQGTTITFTINL
ncbi:MAG: ATP-binding protein [Flavobacteriales bacterium]